MKKDPRVDTYISEAAPFARPVLEHLRERVHTACPDVEETIKWGFPNFVYRGQILCSMAAFKQHCSFGFRNVQGMADPYGLLEKSGKTAMGHFGKIVSEGTLPPDPILTEYIQAAMQAGKKEKPAAKKSAAVPLEIPVDLQDALAANSEAKVIFEAFRPSHKREYLEWIAEAKRPETRARRVEQTITRVLEKQSLHAKYNGKNG